MRNKFLKTALCVLLGVFLLHQLYASVYNPIKTETAEYIKLTDGIEAMGVVIRNETTIERPETGVLHFRVANGERVAKNGIIADIYTSQSDSLCVNKIADIKEQIKNINKIQGYNDLAAVDIGLLNAKIDSSFSDILFEAGNGNLFNSYMYNNELLTILNRKTMIIGENVDFTSQLNSLQSELETLENSLNMPISDIKAGESGFFVSSVDNLENVLTTDDLSKYTPEFLDSINTSSQSSYVGKIVSDYTWYIAVTVDDYVAQNYSPDDRVQLKTSLKNNPTLSVTVAAINKNKGNGKSVMIFSCNEMNTELATIRRVPITIVDGVYEGLKINKSALRFVDGKRGVYVVSGMELKFVTVNVIFSEEKSNYIICDKNSDIDKTALRLYDKVVVKGKNLYDGKIIN